MKKTTATITSAVGLVIGTLHAQTVPPYINYQGRVTDSTGAGLGTGTPVNRKVIFRIFDAPTGGNRLWSEQHTVTIANGEFSVLLGNGIDAVYNSVTETPTKTNTPLDTVFTTSGILRYVEIVVDNGDGTLNTSDAAIAPRQQITSTAYAFRARSADTVASGTDLVLNGSANYGLGYYGNTRLFNGVAVDGPVLYGNAGGALGSYNGTTRNVALRWNSSGAVGVGSADLAGIAPATKLVLQGDDSSTPPAQLSIRGNSDTTKRLLLGYNTAGKYGALQSYSAATATGDLFLNPSGGNVGIGTTTAGSKLTVAGDANISGSLDGVRVAANGTSGFSFNTNDSDGGMFSPADGMVTFKTDAVERMRITNGAIGIGTTTPNTTLEVRSATTPAIVVGTPAGTQGTVYFGNASHGVQRSFSGADNNDVGLYTTAADLYLSTSGRGPNALGGLVLKNGNGYVGIHNSNPQAPLHVSGNSALGTVTLRAFMDPGQIVVNTNQVTTQMWGVWSEGRVRALAYDIVSDERIKSVIGRSDGAKDLEALMGIKITDYTFKDKVENGVRPQKKVIAQELEKVFPLAVGLSTSEVPDIYQKAALKNGWVELATDLKAGERVSLVTDAGKEIYDVAEVTPTRFRVAKPLAGTDVFVYGREVKDFRTVDYDAVAMLNVSATQQLANNTETEVKALREENARLRSELVSMKAAEEGMNARLESIEKAMLAAGQSSEGAAPRTVSVKTRTSSK